MKYLAILLILGLGGLYAFNLLDDGQSGKTKTLSQLEQVGEKCSGIRDRATAGVVPIIEFQKLELESRRANVLTNCMRDHGYVENLAWAPSVMSLAKEHASELGISQDEALEYLRRAAMQSFIPTSNVDYWVAQNKPAKAQ
ncbi:MAG: hypothetical protein U1E13_05515 [Methylophilaceae bacterium]|nr:hypothetical protein [Methylophilaceae bacterium]